jgi:heme-degrading monooxygenase HmoA
VLDVRAGEPDRFEEAFAQAEPLLAGSAGYQRHELRRCMETPGRYLLLVWWDSLEAHTQGFRGSPAYQEWKRLLHHFYEPFPVVEHYAPRGGEEPVAVVVRVAAKEGCEADVRRELHALLAPTRALAGCLESELHEMPDEPTLFLLRERWRSERDFERRWMDESFERWLGLADGLLAEPVQVSRWRRIG